ncbi:MAG: nuclear transport factor 2 family protein [Thermoleophilaceae bacterium]
MATNPELAQRVVDAFTAGDLAGEPGAAALGEALGKIAADDFVCAFIAGAGELMNEFEGVAGLVEGWSDWTSAFESYRVEQDSGTVGDQAVVVFTRQFATLRGSANVVETPAAGAFYFRNGELTRLELHLDRDEALRAAEVESPPRGGGAD